MQCEGETRAALYRFYDSRENLLYVGISVDPWRRWREHVLTQPWYPQAKHWAVTWYDSEPEAARAELRAIQQERPRYNVAGAIRPAEARLTLSFDAVINACAIWMAVPAVLCCAAIALAVGIPVHSRAAVVVRIVGWSAVATSATIPISFGAVLLVACAPSVYRFGCWLDRNFGDLPRQRSRAAAKEREARRWAAHIPVSVWILAPRQTYRVRQLMKEMEAPDYLLALEREIDRQVILAVACDEAKRAVQFAERKQA